MHKHVRDTQVCIDDYLQSIGLEKGELINGKTHFKYVYTDKVVGKITITVSCSPTNRDMAITKSLGNFKRIFKQRLEKKFATSKT